MSEGGASEQFAVVGVGNEIMRDDGVGPRAIERLEDGPLGDRPDVRLYDAGTTGFLALEAISGCDRAILVDAIETGADPGTIREFRFVDGAFEGTPPEITMHDVSFTEALQYAEGAYDLPERVRIFGVEPETVTVGTDLTTPVREALPELTSIIAESIPDRHSQERTIKEVDI